MPAVAPLSHDEAALRIALVLVHADDEEAPPETAAVATVLQERIGDRKRLERMLEAAVRDVHGRDAAQVLARAGAAFTDTASRQWALDMACQIALADHRLRVPESTRLAKLAASLAMPPSAVIRTVEGHWARKQKKTLGEPASAATRPKP